eukprot:TRINITY_DN15023_c0_g1_i1.p1 TRINITY_DN15023_c0_g1~~TRINITY_DN15023_c0_g1_i1.p1  ORF type:complete len:519 (+),score=158.52 TRINITY_DN15023_c0_g1_i1:135-1691(+)
MCFFFFFQAEDGIRDAQESRGLGDVYKRQVLEDHCTALVIVAGWTIELPNRFKKEWGAKCWLPNSPLRSGSQQAQLQDMSELIKAGVVSADTVTVPLLHMSEGLADSTITSSWDPDATPEAVRQVLIRDQAASIGILVGLSAAGKLGSGMTSSGMTYADAGVSIDAGNDLVDQIKPLCKSTLRNGCMGAIGGFGGLFDLKEAGFVDPILVSCTDGVGTKLKLAHMANKHDTVGIDLVAMSVNDLVVQGAEPLFFLDYFACGRLQVEAAAQVIQGVSLACLESGCALIGGETAEMPSMYPPGEYDLAGFAVGAVERGSLLPRTEDIQPNDILLGLRSKGVHSNGFSLVRRIVESLSDNLPEGQDPWQEPADWCDSSDKKTLLDAFLVPTELYVKPCLKAIKTGKVKALCHITGGGLLENLPRVLPGELAAELELDSYPLPGVFEWLRYTGNVDLPEMLRTFNCGVGMVIVCSPDSLGAIEDQVGEVIRLGRVIPREEVMGVQQDQVLVKKWWNTGTESL